MPRDIARGATAAQPAGGRPPSALTSTDPLYKQVRTALVESLASGEWRAGEALPNERALAQRFGVGISTVRAAIGELVALNVLVRRQGKGTFVCREEERRNVYQFFHVVRDDHVRELPVSELLDFRRERADVSAAEALRLPRQRAGQAVYRLHNLLKVAGVPVVVSEITIPVHVFPGLTASRIRNGGPTLYAVYQSLYDVHIVHTDEELRARRCDERSARLLNLHRGDPVLEIRRVARTFHDAPVELRHSVVRTSDYHYALSQGGPSN